MSEHVSPIQGQRIPIADSHGHVRYFDQAKAELIWFDEQSGSEVYRTAGGHFIDYRPSEAMNSISAEVCILSQKDAVDLLLYHLYGEVTEAGKQVLCTLTSGAEW